MNVLDTINGVWDLVLKSKDAALQQAFVDLRIKVVELSEENVKLREDMLTLREQLQKVKRNFRFDGKVYWATGEGDEDGPFCQRCWDSESKAVRLQEDRDGWRCFDCKTFYRTKPCPPLPSHY